jgi:hypothetical protein
MREDRSVDLLEVSDEAEVGKNLKPKKKALRGMSFYHTPYQERGIEQVLLYHCINGDSESAVRASKTLEIVRRTNPTCKRTPLSRFETSYAAQQTF